MFSVAFLNSYAKIKRTMKKNILSALIAVLVSGSVYADGVNLGVSGAYSSDYIVNGTVRATDAFKGGINASKDIGPFVLSLNSDFITDGDGGTEQAHWGVSGSKAFEVGGYGLTLNAGAIRHHQGGVSGIQNSLEFGAGATLATPLADVTLRGIADVDLEQYGFAVGIARTFDLVEKVTITPSLEYGSLSDYDYWTASATLQRPIEVAIGTVSPFVSVNVIDNSFDNGANGLAAEILDVDVVVVTGLSLSF